MIYLTYLYSGNKSYAYIFEFIQNELFGELIVQCVYYI